MHGTLRLKRGRIVIAAALLTALSAVVGPYLMHRAGTAASSVSNAAARIADDTGHTPATPVKEKKMIASPANSADTTAQDEPRDENRRTFQLASGARVEVLNISGTVDIETTEAGPAEVQIIRSARRAEDLKYHQVTIEQTATGLVVRGHEDREAYRGGRQVQQQVKLKLPRDVSLTLRGVGGHVTVGEVDGDVQVERIGGGLELGLVGGKFEAANLGGHLRAGLRGLEKDGIRISQVGGHVELHFRRELNADLEVSRMSGRLHADVPNVTMLTPESAVLTRARVGAGGAALSISKVGGNVRLTQGL
jgi:hypothetical protein